MVNRFLIICNSHLIIVWVDGMCYGYYFFLFLRGDGKIYSGCFVLNRIVIEYCMLNYIYENKLNLD